MARAIKEAIYIRVNNPTLNRNIDKYNLPHIWNKVLFTIPELKNQINTPQHYNICALMKFTGNKTSAPKHLCLRRFTAIMDFCTVTSVPHEVYNKIKISINKIRLK